MRNYKEKYEKLKKEKDYFKQKLDNSLINGRPLTDEEKEYLLKQRDELNTMFVIGDYEEEYQMANNEKVKYSDFPNLFKQRITKGVLYIIGCLVFCMMSIILEFTNIYIFIPCFIIILYLLKNIYNIYIHVSNNDYIIFSGIVNYVENRYEKITVLKETIVEIVNDEKFLAFSTKNNKIKEGMPITLYLSKETQITQTEYGPMALSYITYELSAYNNKDEIINLNKKKNMSAEDFISNNNN